MTGTLKDLDMNVDVDMDMDMDMLVEPQKCFVFVFSSHESVREQENDERKEGWSPWQPRPGLWLATLVLWIPPGKKRDPTETSAREERQENITRTLRLHLNLTVQKHWDIYCAFLYIYVWFHCQLFLFFFSFVPPVFQALIGCGEDASWVCRQLPLIAQNTLQTHSKITLQNKAGP